MDFNVSSLMWFQIPHYKQPLRDYHFLWVEMGEGGREGWGQKAENCTWTIIKEKKKKKLSVVEFWCCVKEYPQLSEKTIKIVFLFPAAYFWDAGFSSYTSSWNF